MNINPIIGVLLSASLIITPYSEPGCTQIETVSVETEPGCIEEALPSSYQLDVTYISQLPELPTGCEVTALTTVLNYLGYDVDKCDMADNYMPKGNIYYTDPDYAFMGDPHDYIKGWGCFAPAIVTTATNYFNTIGSNKDIALNISGIDLDTLCRGIYDFQRPAIIWASNDMHPITKGKSWYVNGKKITWRNYNHCLVLIGWDEENYIVSDPLKGIVSYNKELFNQRYEENQKNVVFIFDKETLDVE